MVMKGINFSKIASWLLLAVYLPILLASSFHTHHTELQEPLECAACVHHESCPGHLDTGNIQMHDCVLCQFLQLTFFATASVAFLVCKIIKSVYQDLRTASVRVYKGGPTALRAPPCFC
jgi:hypothetical protein